MGASKRPGVRESAVLEVCWINAETGKEGKRLSQWWSEGETQHRNSLKETLAKECICMRSTFNGAGVPSLKLLMLVVHEKVKDGSWHLFKFRVENVDPAILPLTDDAFVKISNRRFSFWRASVDCWRRRAWKYQGGAYLVWCSSRREDWHRIKSPSTWKNAAETRHADTISPTVAPVRGRGGDG